MKQVGNIIADVLREMIEKYESQILQIEELWPKGPEYCPAGILEIHDELARLVRTLKWKLKGIE